MVQKKAAANAIVKKTETTKNNNNFLRFWDDNGGKTVHSYLIEATEQVDGKHYARISVESRFSKAKDTLGVLVTLGKKATMYFGASTKKLGRVFVGEPKKIESTETKIEENIL